MKLIHYLCLVLILAVTVFGSLVILGKVEVPQPAEAEQVLQENPATEAPTAAPTETPTEAPTEAPTEPPTEPQPQSFVLTFVGNCTLGCNEKMLNVETAFPLTVGQNFNYPMANVRSYFLEDEYSFANLEGTLGGKGTAKNQKYVFTGSAEYTKIFTENGVEVVSLANNHSMDFQEEGYEETKRILQEAGIDFAENLSSTLITTDRGLVIGLYAVDFTGEDPEETVVEAGIRQLKESGAEVVVCAFHWGAENTYRANDAQEKYGHLAIDAGADIVWGHHPSVLQPIEEYNGGVIFYSLGHFVFGGNSAPKDYDSAIVQQEMIRQLDGTITMGKRTIVPCSVSSVSRINNYQPTPYEEGSKEYNRVLSKLDGSFKGVKLPN